MLLRGSVMARRKGSSCRSWARADCGDDLVAALLNSALLVRGKGAFPRRQAAGACGDGRIDDLTDDLLLIILRRLDTRSALPTAALSKRWAGLSRGLDALDFMVSGILPPRYHRWIQLHQAATRLFNGDEVSTIVASIRRYERLAMRNMVVSINHFLDGDDDFACGGGAPRRKDDIVVDASSSMIRQLVLESCGLTVIKLHALPMLESIVVMQTRVRYKLGSFPHLTRLNLSLRYGMAVFSKWGTGTGRL
ncbi:hypothetical protein E2562_025988 [Oryza meyeriana var. granulata]|uniref:F-box domain-containing protein n=1 Tax=Oryza meyeriana var. granulata TaxID=110450 RepID=A0A6G1EPC8_9ORYZ|nr:hypothetical protein E2562_025988 [Oryza meyeriana var. granulata]